jgi:PadR family transcriptional regulator PadR
MRKELVAASAEPMILALLARGESYGYAIIQEIGRRSQEKIQWTEGMLYPVLHRLEENRWIKARWVEGENGRKRKYYSLTKAGQKELSEQHQNWMAVHDVLSGLGKADHEAIR